MKNFCLTILSGALLIVLTACGSTHHVSHLSAKVECGVSMAKWYNEGGKARIVILEDQLKPMISAAEAHKKNELPSDAKAVEAASTSLKSNLPPNCVPGLNTQVSALLTDANKSAKDATSNNLTDLKTQGHNARKSAEQIFKITEKFIR